MIGTETVLHSTTGNVEVVCVESLMGADFPAPRVLSPFASAVFILLLSCLLWALLLAGGLMIIHRLAG